MVQRKRPDHSSQTRDLRLGERAEVGGGEGAAGRTGRPCWSPRDPALVGEVPSETSMLNSAPIQLLKEELEKPGFP